MLPSDERQELNKEFGKSLAWHTHEIFPKYYEISHSIIPEHKSLLTPKMFDIMLARQFKKFVKSNKIFTFSFVRHPFERLVSAYKDMVIGNGGMFMKSIGYLKWFKISHSFSDFVDLVIQEYNRSQCTSLYKRECLNINEHWRSLSSKCSFCDITYDVVGKMEDFSEDVRYIILKNNLSDKIAIEKLDVLRHKSKFDTKNITQEYISQLKKSQITDKIIVLDNFQHNSETSSIKTFYARSILRTNS